MKHSNKRTLNEILGVPEGILESAEKLYNIIGNKIKNLKDPIKEENSFSKNVELIISDYIINEVKINLTIIETDQVNDIKLASMGYVGKSRFSHEKLILMSVTEDGKLTMSVTFAVPYKTKIKDILDFFVKDKTLITSVLSHELGHAYNVYKKKNIPLKQMSTYSGRQKTNFPISSAKQFIYYLYFIHSIENLVRPIEVASFIKSENIDREKFYEFLLDNTTYKTLKEINEFSYEKFREDLKKEIPKIKNFFKNLNIPITKFKNDDEIIDEFLRLIYVNLANNTADTLKNILTKDFNEMMFGFKGEKQIMFNRLENLFWKFEHEPLKYFKYEENNFKKVSEKMMRKLSKLYALIKQQ